MLALVLVASVVAVALLGLRQRRQRDGGERIDTVAEEPRVISPQGWRQWLPLAKAQLKSLWKRWLPVMVVLVASAVILGAGIYLYTDPSMERRTPWSPTTMKGKTVDMGCKPMNLQETVSSWDYVHRTPGLGNVSDNSAVQTLFNQGLLWRWGFSLQGAHDAFSLAVQEDPSCAMCHWGLAYAVSPFPNIVALPDGTPFPHFSDAMNKEGRRFLEEAARCQMRSEKERTYIDAMWIRFPEVDHVERGHQEWVEFLFGAKMLSTWKSDMGDLVAGSLAAEAFVNCIPWDYYDSELDEDQQPTPFDDGITWADLLQWKFPSREASEFSSVTGLSTGERILDAFPLQSESLQNKMRDISVKPLARVVEHLLLKMMELEPFHPMALHIHIHLTEASKEDGPQKGFQSAMKLGKASLQWKAGHLIHMPSHNFLRVGEYRKGIESNEAAHKVDVEISERCMPPYVPEHNLNVLIASASMGGFFDVAEKYSVVLRQLPDRITQRKYMAKGFDYVSLLDVWGQFGKWEKILAAEPPSEGARGSSMVGGFDFATAMYHFYRYMAQTHRRSHASRGRRMLVEDASLNVDFQAFKEAAAKVPPTVRAIPGQGVGVSGAPHYEWAQIAMLYAEARNATLFGEIERAISSVEEIEALATEMGYMEPPWTQQDPKQCLAYLLMQNKKYDEAEGIYKQDLIQNPHNPWSTLGSSQLYSLLNRPKEAKALRIKYENSDSAELTCSCPMLEID